MRVIVEEAHKQKRKVAAHATTPEGIKNALLAGVDSIEHGHGANREDLEMMKKQGVFLVPTLGVVDASIEAHRNEVTPDRRKGVDALLQGIQVTVQTARSLGVKIVAGFDAASGELQAKNATELAAMMKRGLTPLETIQAATVSAAELLSSQDSLGALEPGHYADVIAVVGDPLADITVLHHVKFVMKGGSIIKNEVMP